MKKIKLTQGKFAIVDDQDYEWLNQWNWFYGGAGYAIRNITNENGRTILRMHRLILNVPKGMDTDHINFNRLDNRRENLRIATRSQNLYNKVKPRSNTSGFKGVGIRKESKTKPYIAFLSTERKRIYLGYHKTAREAAIAYNKAALKYFGEFARLNII